MRAPRWTNASGGGCPRPRASAWCLTRRVGGDRVYDRLIGARDGLADDLSVASSARGTGCEARDRVLRSSWRATTGLTADPDGCLEPRGRGQSVLCARRPPKAPSRPWRSEAVALAGRVLFSRDSRRSGNAGAERRTGITGARRPRCLRAEALAGRRRCVRTARSSPLAGIRAPTGPSTAGRSAALSRSGRGTQPEPLGS